MTDRIITSLSEIDEKHLIAYQRKKNDYQRSKRISLRWISIAAALVLILGGTLLGKFFSQKINKEPELSKEFYNSYAEMFEEAKNRSHNTSNIHLPKHISDLYTDLDFYSYSDNASVIAKDFGKVYVVAFKKETTQIKMVYQPLKNDHFLQYGIYNPDIDYDDSETINSITVSFKQFDGVIEGYFSDVSGDYYIQYHSMNKEDFVLFLYEIITFN